MFFYIKCVLFVLVLSISGEISAQEKRDSVRIYFHQGKVNIDTCLLDNGNEMERFAKICSALNDSVRLIRKIQIIGGASPEGGGLLNGRLSEKRAEVLWRYISPYIKIPVLEKDFHFSGSDWNGLITIVRADVNVPEREDVLRLLEKIVRLENHPAQDQAAREMGLRLVEHCQQVNVYGTVRTPGMLAEIRRAEELNIPVKADQPGLKKKKDRPRRGQIR